MITILRNVAAAELGLTIVEALVPKLCNGFLPLGGSPLSQIGFLFGVAFILFEWSEGISKIRTSWKKGQKKQDSDTKQPLVELQKH